jgi:hypothetical protein
MNPRENSFITGSEKIMASLVRVRYLSELAFSRIKRCKTCWKKNTNLFMSVYGLKGRLEGTTWISN